MREAGRGEGKAVRNEESLSVAGRQQAKAPRRRTRGRQTRRYTIVRTARRSLAFSRRRFNQSSFPLAGRQSNVVRVFRRRVPPLRNCPRAEFDFECCPGQSSGIMVICHRAVKTY